MYILGPSKSRIISWKYSDPCLLAQYARIGNAPVMNTNKHCKRWRKHPVTSLTRLGGAVKFIFVSHEWPEYFVRLNHDFVGSLETWFFHNSFQLSATATKIHYTFSNPSRHQYIAQILCQFLSQYSNDYRTFCWKRPPLLELGNSKF